MEKHPKISKINKEIQDQVYNSIILKNSFCCHTVYTQESLFIYGFCCIPTQKHKSHTCANLFHSSRESGFFLNYYVFKLIHFSFYESYLIWLHVHDCLLGFFNFTIIKLPRSFNMNALKKKNTFQTPEWRNRIPYHTENSNATDICDWESKRAKLIVLSGCDGRLKLSTLTITATITSNGHLWAEVCGRRQIVSVLCRPMMLHEQKFKKIWLAALHVSEEERVGLRPTWYFRF